MKKYKLNLEKSPTDNRDYIAESIFPAKGETPDALDLRKDLQPIRDQGSQGTCAAQTSACMKEWQEKKDVDFDEHMSPQFIYNNRENQTDEGMYSRDVMRILHKIGSCPEKEYPYETDAPITESLEEIAKKYTIKGYASVGTIDALKKALIKSGPCYIAVPVYNYGMRMWKPEQGDRMQGGHAMCIVGYTKKGFIIRNSWSDDWGENGYTIFPYEDWGLQWEVWTTIDEESPKPLPPVPIRKSFWGWLVSLLKKLFR